MKFCGFQILALMAAAYAGECFIKKNIIKQFNKV